jgi:hypothetical protein
MVGQPKDSAAWAQHLESYKFSPGLQLVATATRIAPV